MSFKYKIVIEFQDLKRIISQMLIDSNSVILMELKLEKKIKF